MQSIYTSANLDVRLILYFRLKSQESDVTKPVTREREWVRYDFHYDNVPKVITATDYDEIFTEQLNY